MLARSTFWRGGTASWPVEGMSDVRVLQRTQMQPLRSRNPPKRSGVERSMRDAVGILALQGGEDVKKDDIPNVITLLQAGVAKQAADDVMQTIHRQLKPVA